MTEEGRLWANCIPCMKRGPGGWLQDAEPFKDQTDHSMARGRCGGCGKRVDQDITVQKYMALSGEPLL